jgi:citrate synthase
MANINDVNNSDALEGVTAVSFFIFNGNADELMAAAYGHSNHADSYAAEKLDKMQNKFMWWWGELSDGNRARFVEHALIFHSEHG